MSHGLCDNYPVQKGFSLIEVMVAMIIMSLSLTLLYNAVATSTNNTRVADEYLRAVMLAESVLAANRLVAEPDLSLTDSYEKYDWELRIWPVNEEKDNARGEANEVLPELYFLSVVVFWPSGEKRRSFDLLSIVPLQVGVK